MRLNQTYNIVFETEINWWYKPMNIIKFHRPLGHYLWSGLIIENWWNAKKCKWGKELKIWYKFIKCFKPLKMTNFKQPIFVEGFYLPNSLSRPISDLNQWRPEGEQYKGSRDGQFIYSFVFFLVRSSRPRVKHDLFLIS